MAQTTATTQKKIKRNTGVNGVGSKLAGILGDWFQARVFDLKKVYKQVATKNLTKIEEAEVRDAEKADGKDPFVEVSFVPDKNRLGIDGYDEDFIDRIRYFCCCIAYNSQIRFTINDDVIEPLNIYEYMTLEYPEVDPKDFIVGYLQSDVEYKTVKTEFGPLEVPVDEAGVAKLEYALVVSVDKEPAISLPMVSTPAMVESTSMEVQGLQVRS